jgi:pimeloyl-ACP methyl ester carboxylesterase
MRCVDLALRFFRVILFLASLTAIAQTTGGKSVQSGYAAVNGLKMYYEIHGDGEPLVLVHGGVVGISMFGGNVDALAKSRKVIAVELQGHAHTPDIDRPLSFEALADDVVALVKHLGLQRVDVMGYSLGGGVALQVAIRHPEVVRKLVVVSAPCKRRGMYPEVLAAMDQMGPGTGQMMKQSPLSKMYPNVDWETLFTKLGKLLSTEYDWSKEVTAVRAPTMLVFADADAVRPEHIVEFYRLIGGGQRDAGQNGSARSINQLAILPGQTHYTIDAAPALIANVAPFLDAALPSGK